MATSGCLVGQCRPVRSVQILPKDVNFSSRIRCSIADAPVSADSMVRADATEPLLLRTVRGESVERPPVWMMRQAGRYMKSYQDLCAKYPSFRERSENADLAIEISLQPWKAFKPDGVILFSDILTPLTGMNIPFDILPGRGPIIDKPISSMEDVDEVTELCPEEAVPYVGEILSALRNEVGNEAAVLGFVGAPFTLASYIIEGGSSKHFAKIKRIAFNNPEILHALLQKLAESVIIYIRYQADKGAQTVQIFDSWATHLSPVDFEQFSLPYLRQIVSEVNKTHPSLPLILYASGSGGLLERLGTSGVDVVSVDWTVDMAEARQRLGRDIAVQGNMDPGALFGSKDFIGKRVHDTVEKAGKHKHILNLGHGVLVGTPEENVAHFFEVGKSIRGAIRRCNWRPSISSNEASLFISCLYIWCWWGVKSIFKMDDISVMGLTELIPHLFTFSTRLRQTMRAVTEFNPHVIVTIDSKGFSFRLLKRVKEFYARSGQASPLCVHYVAPSFWAWKGGEEKLKNLSKIVDHLLCILPFEEQVCKHHGLKATFVGHPVLEDSFDAADSAVVDLEKWLIRGNSDKFRENHGLTSASPVLTVLPGSRLQELNRMLPIYGAALNRLSVHYPDIAAIIPTVANQSLTRTVKYAVRLWNMPVTILPGATLEQKYNAFSASDAALTTSGTAVMQLQLCRVPSVVAYRANFITEMIIKHRTKLKYISLPNILLHSPHIPEALFSSCTPEQIQLMIRTILEDPMAKHTQALAAESVLKLVQPPQYQERPSSIAASVILKDLLKSGKAN